ncbi:DUF4347 domain-containing protein, partial [Spiribacter sp. 1M153]|uniref:DUF4347 domain-containing protein n=1 Tax=Spiribacter roseus TaxID=1855875 RepID=UPI00349F25E9
MDTSDKREALIIDASVEQMNTLLEGLNSSVCAPRLVARDDDPAQSSRNFPDDPSVTSLHLLGHGCPKPIAINYWAWHIGAGAKGTTSIQISAEHSMVDVFTSTDLIGDKDQGASWELNASVAPREPVPFSREARNTFQSVLSRVSFTGASETVVFVGGGPVRIGERFNINGLEPNESSFGLDFELGGFSGTTLANTEFIVNGFNPYASRQESGRIVLLVNNEEVGNVYLDAGDENRQTANSRLNTDLYAASRTDADLLAETVLDSLRIEYLGDEEPVDNEGFINLYYGGTPTRFDVKIVNPVDVTLQASDYQVGEGFDKFEIAPAVEVSGAISYESISADVSGGTKGDRLSLVDAGTAVTVLNSARLAANGEYVEIFNQDGVWEVVGRVDSVNNGVDGSRLTINFTVPVTDAVASGIAQAITFEHNSDAPPSDSRTITVSAVDSENGVTGTATTSLTIAGVKDAPTGTVFIEGDVQEGSTLTANTDSLEDADGLGTLNYQWSRADSADGEYTPISGATDATYTVTGDDATKFLNVTVSYNDGQGNDESLTSAPTTKVGPTNTAPTVGVGNSDPSYTEVDGADDQSNAETIDPDLTVTDSDSAIRSATVTVTNARFGDELLSDTAVSGITAAPNPAQSTVDIRTEYISTNNSYLIYVDSVAGDVSDATLSFFFERVSDQNGDAIDDVEVVVDLSSVSSGSTSPALVRQAIEDAFLAEGIGTRVSQGTSSGDTYVDINTDAFLGATQPELIQTAQLTLIADDSVSNSEFQSALRGVKFNNTTDNPDESDRTVE